MTQFKDVIFEKNVAIHCPEEWMANELLKYADSRDYVWISGKRYTEYNNWNYKHNTVYIISRGTCADISYAERNKYKILHYSDVIIKEENNMETSLEYKLIIKGKEAKIGSGLFAKERGDYFNIKLKGVRFSENYIEIKYYNIDKDNYFITINLDDLYWEKPIIYQLPDTDGNLSEVKIGQEVWVYNKRKNKIEKGIIDSFAKPNYKGDVSLICIETSNLNVYYDNITGMRSEYSKATTNKPKRDFSQYFDFNQAPKGYNYGAVDKTGVAFWYKVKPKMESDFWGSDYSDYLNAGFRQNLINPETGKVDDWEDSLVERPKETK